jgi:nucleoside-diphosphate-sugar epimerase
MSQIALDASSDLLHILSGVMPFDAVVHCATCYGRNGESENEIRTANFEFPRRLLTAVAELGIPTFINTDTILPSTINAYALTKAEFRDWGAGAVSVNRLSFVNVAFDHMYGPGEEQTKFISNITSLCLRNSPIDLTEGQQMRDFIYISDLTEAYVTILSERPGHFSGLGDLKVGTGNPATIRAVVEMIHQLAGSRSELRFGAIAYREHEPMLCSINSAKLQQLGWSPKVSLSRGLFDVVDFERRRMQ